MYVQRFVKGISSRWITWDGATDLLKGGHGIQCNWWRNKPDGKISPPEIEAVLTADNLDRHLHDYDAFGPETPFISLATGCVERDTLLAQNHVHSALTTALDFATDAGRHPGVLVFGWVIVSLNPAVEIQGVAEEVRNLNVYHRWSPFQLEGEVTAKIIVPANQLQRIEWWDLHTNQNHPQQWFDNPAYVEPTPITNLRDLF